LVPGVIYLGVKRIERKARNSPLSEAKVMNLAPKIFHGAVVRNRKYLMMMLLLLMMMESSNSR
jgi:hypothetical protein